MRASQEYVDLALRLCMVLMVIVQALSANQAGRHTYVVRYKHGDNQIPVTVVLDYKRQTEYVINMNSRSPAQSMTLYDFKERIIAYKDLKNGECFIGRLLHETIQEEDAVLKRLKNPVESEPLILTLEPERPSLTPTEVRNMAGHKAAVFCRRMNTWTLLPEKDNRRVRRDTLRHLDRSPSRHEDYSKSHPAAPQKSEVSTAEQDNTHRNRRTRDGNGFQRNGSIIRRKNGQYETISSQKASISDATIQHERLSNVYPFILPRLKIFDKEGRSPSRQDDIIQRFGFAQERSDVQPLSGFFQSRLTGLDNGTLPISSTKHDVIPLEANHPVIIPSINLSSKSESKLPEDQSVNEVNSRSELPDGYPRNVNIFNTLHNRGEVPDKYPPFHQLPPEAYVLPLTRPPIGTTAQPFIFRNRLGYEIVYPESQSNNSHILTSPDGSLTPSVAKVKSVQTARSAHGLHPSSIKDLDHPEASASAIAAPSVSRNSTRRKENDDSTTTGKDFNYSAGKEGFYVDAYTRQGLLPSPDRSSNQTVESYGEANISSISHFANSDFPSLGRSDIPIQVPRWYPEITKQISIPLELDVLHHQEEYAHGVINKTEEVHSVRGHEVEDFSSLPNNVNTLIPIPIEGHSNGVRPEKELKLLPHVTVIPEGDSSKESVNQASGKKGEKVDRGTELTEFRRNTYRGTKNASLLETFPHKQTPSQLLTNDTEVIDSVSVSSGRQNVVNHIAHPAPPYKGAAEESRQIPKRQHQFNEGSLAVHDVKIDEGVPSYRKRFPPVSQLFTPDETVANAGRLPDRHIRLTQQNSQVRRRPSAFRNKTHGIHPRGHESKSAWRKVDLASRNLINQQQTHFTDQGITFHHRGYGKPSSPRMSYDYHRKRLGILPPGVSVHPRHPQAPYADLAAETMDKTIPGNPLLQSRPRRVHLRHHRRHQRKRNRIQPSPDVGLPGANCCGGDGQNCCLGSRRRGRHFSNAGCCSKQRESRRPNLVLPPQTDGNEVSSRKKVDEVPEDRCMKEKMCRTVYQSTKKVLVCRNVDVEGC